MELQGGSCGQGLNGEGIGDDTFFFLLLDADN